MSALRSFRVLANEAVADAVRRRAVAAIAAVSVLSLFAIDGCTACTGGAVVVNGEAVRLPQVAGAAGLSTFAMVSAWCIALAGILAADHLVQTLEDGSAQLCLARPVGRTTFAMARLSGALSIALATGVLLLGAMTVLLGARSGLPAGPAWLGVLAFALGALVMSALAMTASLFLPRIASVLLVFASVGAVFLANALSLANRAPDGLLGVLDRFGPPWTTAVVLALAPWVPQLTLTGDPLAVALRGVVWVGLSLAALALVFARIELARSAP